VTVIDANGLILGRLASIVAQRLLSGEEIDVINAERAVVSGSPVTTLSKYQTLRKKGSKEKGPYFPKRSDMILRRTVRGMLPYKRSAGLHWDGSEFTLERQPSFPVSMLKRLNARKKED